MQLDFLFLNIQVLFLGKNLDSHSIVVACEQYVARPYVTYWGVPKAAQ